MGVENTNRIFGRFMPSMYLGSLYHSDGRLYIAVICEDICFAGYICHRYQRKLDSIQYHDRWEETSSSKEKVYWNRRDARIDEWVEFFLKLNSCHAIIITSIFISRSIDRFSDTYSSLFTIYFGMLIIILCSNLLGLNAVGLDVCIRNDIWIHSILLYLQF